MTLILRVKLQSFLVSWIWGNCRQHRAAASLTMAHKWQTSKTCSLQTIDIPTLPVSSCLVLCPSWRQNRPWNKAYQVNRTDTTSFALLPAKIQLLDHGCALWDVLSSADKCTSIDFLAGDTAIPQKRNLCGVLHPSDIEQRGGAKFASGLPAQVPLKNGISQGWLHPRPALVL